MDADGIEQILQVPIYPVHDYLFAIHDLGEHQFGASCFGSNGIASVREFWDHFYHLDWVKNHPAMLRPHRMPDSLPASLFADDARLFKSEKMIVWELSLFFITREDCCRKIHHCGITALAGHPE